ncbi:MAG TPA: type II secretion system F family protein [Planctomycetota bacterium]
MIYKYEAIDEAGKTATGTAEAPSLADARAQLRGRGLLPVDLEEVEAAAKPRARGASWMSLSGHRLDLLARMTRHWALLLRTGLPMADALAALGPQVEDERFRLVLEEVRAKVREGVDVADALAAQPRWFPDLFVHIVRAGIQAGELAKVLVELGVYYTKQKKIRDRVVSALTYPALMCAVGALVLVFLLTFVVPKVTAILLEQERALPWPTEVLLSVSGALSTSWWWLVPGVAAAAWIGAKSVGRKTRDRLLLRVPVLGNLLRKQATARWAGTMSTLLRSGIPVAQALAVVRGAAGNAALEEDVARLEKEVLEGASLSEALKRSRVLPSSVGLIAGVGEESGELAEVFREVAETYDDEVEVASTRLTDLLNPVIIVLLGLVVGFIVAAILLPITDFSNLQ